MSNPEPNQDLPGDSRLGQLVDELQAKIAEIKATVQPMWEQLQQDVRAKADEISDAIDAKVEEIKAAVQQRGNSGQAPGQNKPEK
jgi:F0F1-type ATP synthase membrane subunit b/b'